MAKCQGQRSRSKYSINIFNVLTKVKVTRVQVEDCEPRSQYESRCFFRAIPFEIPRGGGIE